MRVHISPLRLGPPVTTEFYECPSCDSSLAFDPLAGKWKFWTAEN